MVLMMLTILIALIVHMSRMVLMMPTMLVTLIALVNRMVLMVLLVLTMLVFLTKLLIVTLTDKASESNGKYQKTYIEQGGEIIPQPRFPPLSFLK